MDIQSDLIQLPDFLSLEPPKLVRLLDDLINDPNVDQADFQQLSLNRGHAFQMLGLLRKSLQVSSLTFVKPVSQYCSDSSG